MTNVINLDKRRKEKELPGHVAEAGRIMDAQESPPVADRLVWTPKHGIIPLQEYLENGHVRF